MRSVGCALTLQRQRASGLVIAPPARTLNAGRTHAPLLRSEFTMFKRFSLLWALIRGDARLLWRALRHPQSPGWLKLGALGIVLYVISPIDLIPDVIPVIGLLDDIVLVPLAIRFLLNRLPAQLRADIGAGPRAA
jgi:uncharacterized membrane protein YkvA (DUF1232 family)